jgi:hypothetical protein
MRNAVEYFFRGHGATVWRFQVEQECAIEDDLKTKLAMLVLHMYCLVIYASHIKPTL